MSVAHHIGLEIAEGCFRLVELQRQDHHTVVLRADVYETALDYACPRLFDLPFDRDLAKTFISDLVHVLTASTVYAPGVSIVLPSDLPLVATLPMDASLPERERSVQLEWECRMLMGLPEATPMSVLSHPLRDDSEARSALVVALPHAVVDFLNTTFSYLTFELAAIDVDHFVMENMVRRLYPRDSRESVAILGMFDSHCSAGMYVGAHYCGYRMSTVTYRQQYSSQALRLIESISSRKLDHVYCFGAGFDQHIGNALHSLLKADVVRCLPMTDPEAEAVFIRSCGPHGVHVFDTAAAAAMQGLG